MRKDVGEKARNGIAGIEYVVGSDKGLEEIVGGEEIAPLLKSAILAGASGAEVTGPEGRVLWREGAPEAADGDVTEQVPIRIEGETAGGIVVRGNCPHLKGLAHLLFTAVKMVTTNNLKRMLTTELHTSVVNQTHEELLETNNRLRASEARYRELAESLDRKVQERTEELKRAHARLLQQEKIASVGQLAAGVAHEINTPLGFISSNLNTLKRYSARFREMLDFYRDLLERKGDMSAAAEASRRKWRELKLDFILRDVEELVVQSLEGAERVSKIVSDLKGFSHVDDSSEDLVDVNREIERTLSVLAHEIPEDARIVRNYRPLPPILCNPALICQVFLNIILNALQAREEGLELRIDTENTDGNILISFSDNGPGIPEEIRNRIFEPFYTTKEVGKGTGLGLTVTHDIITAYGGDIEVKSKQGEGTTFIVRLPAKGRKDVKVR